MGLSNYSSCFTLLVLILVVAARDCHGDERSVPAVYVFGDSLADVGNNNHLDFTLLKADFPHNGIDFPGRKATGRFSNGKNFADFLAENLGVPTSPPYLSLSSISNNTSIYLNGINFASGGSGISSMTNKDQCISFDKQIDYYSTVYGTLVQQLGQPQTLDHLAQSIFAVVIGSNDLINYAKSNMNDKVEIPSRQFVNLLVASFQGQLQRIYNLGARKFILLGTGPVGCCPSLREQNKTQGCNQGANALSVQYNKAVSSLLHQISTQNGDMSYSFFDTSSALLRYIQQPDQYGFVEIKAACCGLGDLNTKVACIPLSTYCKNRQTYIFWDLYHPTETTARMLTSMAFDGSAPFVSPMNIKQLSSV